MRKSRRKDYDGERNMQRLRGKEEVGKEKERDESNKQSYEWDGPGKN